LFVAVTEANPMPEAAIQAKEAFEFVLEHGRRIVYDHHIVYWTRECPPYALANAHINV
jgi:hypothetical protein